MYFKKLPYLFKNSSFEIKNLKLKLSKQFNCFKRKDFCGFYGITSINIIFIEYLEDCILFKTIFFSIEKFLFYF